MHIPGSKTYEYHRKTYGNKEYMDFVPIFNDEIKRWDAEKMADLFKHVGARYVVLTTKHHGREDLFEIYYCRWFHFVA
jgi:alpha-L-fucosidase